MSNAYIDFLLGRPRLGPQPPVARQHIPLTISSEVAQSIIDNAELIITELYFTLWVVIPERFPHYKPTRIETAKYVAHLIVRRRREHFKARGCSLQCQIDYINGRQRAYGALIYSSRAPEIHPVLLDALGTNQMMLILQEIELRSQLRNEVGPEPISPE